MSLGIKVELRLLEKPPSKVNCNEEYTFPEHGTPLYRVCVTSDSYIVYDTVVEDPRGVSELKKLEAKLYDILVGEEPLVERLGEIRDERLRHIVERQLLGYGVLEPFFMDPNIVNAHIIPNKPIQVIHRLHGRLKANIALSAEEVKELALRLSASAGKPLSEAFPLASFIEPRYEARVSVVFVSDVTLRRSMLIDIRKQPENPWTVLKLINLGSISVEEAAFLWLMIKYKVPVVIVGELMSGKTTLATALLAFIPPGSRVLTAEDTPEFRVPMEYWTRTTTREFGEYKVTYFDLIKTGVRLSLDYIIVGEIRGEEAREWAHSILLGHGTITTFHAESPESALLRLLSPPISMDPQVVKYLNVFVKTNVIEREPGKQVFRHELYVVEEGRSTPLFVYDPVTDRIQLNPAVKNPLSEFKFVERVAVVHRVPREVLYREYMAMVGVLREVYHEALRIDPTLETPTHLELPSILYKKLEEKLRAGVVVPEA